ncbi:MAG: heat-shock protein Hsp20 [Candidatus Rokuibacteriota bacterium]|nr:MAG: heat-shock protein Hsp20 [Candidatus Rokubacteria bacterium]
MRYRRVTFRSTRLRTGQPWPLVGAWEHESLRLLLQARWRPAADMSETATAIEVTVDLAGVDEDDFEVQLFENGLVVEGRRQLPSCGEDAVYHAAGIPQGLFRVELPLPARIDPDRVEARYERGLLHVTLPKRA